MGRPQVHSQFTVSSGCLCYGALHNIWYGSMQPIQVFPTSLEAPTGGTVKIQTLYHNTVARNGIWLVYQLKDLPTGRKCGWFVCHSEIEPDVEINRILRVAGSPYEHTESSSKNDELTFAGAVLVINRYDWGWYDDRGKEDVDIEDDEDILDHYEAVGLVDRGSAQEYVDKWRREDSIKRKSLTAGVWMHIPQMEYMFGRFGFDDQRKAAQSFLFFTANTVFTRTALAGVNHAIDRASDQVNDEEIVQSHLWVEEASDSEGLIQLKAELGNSTDVRPMDGEPLGFNDQARYVLQLTDLNAIRSKKTSHPFHKRWERSIYICLNEMVLSYLEHFVVPIPFQDSVLAFAATLFPMHEKPRTLDNMLYKALEEPGREVVPGLDRQFVGRKTQDFLVAQKPRNDLFQREDFIESLVAALSVLMSEVLELSDQHRMCYSRKNIFPRDIRLATFRNEELLNAFRYSSYFWRGNMAADV